MGTYHYFANPEFIALVDTGTTAEARDSRLTLPPAGVNSA
jgi:hypothetical protein